MSKIVCICFFALLSTTALAQSTGLSLSAESRFLTVPVQQQELFVVVSFSAPALSGSATSPPVSITAVLDRSGSMQGQKINLLKRSTEFVVTQLRTSDRMGVVSYSSDVTVDVPLTSVTRSSRSGIREAIDAIVARGATNLAGGLFAGIDQQTEADLPGTVVRSIILFTDGLANQGITDIRTIVSRIQSSLNIPQSPAIYALGFGGDHDIDFLQSIARAGNGQYVFVPDANAIPGAIGTILGGLLTTTAQNIVVELTPRNGVSIISIQGGNVDNSLRRTTFPDLFAEEQRDILIKLRIPVLRNALENQAILDVTLTYFNTIIEQTETRRSTIVINRSIGVVTSASASALVESTILRFQIAEDIEKAVDQAEAGDSAGATATLDASLEAIEASPVAGTATANGLASDVTTARSTVASGNFTPQEATAARATANSAAVQRSSGAGSSGSVQSTSTQASVSSAASAFRG